MTSPRDSHEWNDEAEEARERNPDSSVSPQYEDHILPDQSWQHEDES